MLYIIYTFLFFWVTGIIFLLEKSEKQKPSKETINKYSKITNIKVKLPFSQSWRKDIVQHDLKDFEKYRAQWLYAYWSIILGPFLIFLYLWIFIIFDK